MVGLRVILSVALLTLAAGAWVATPHGHDAAGAAEAEAAPRERPDLEVTAARRLAIFRRAQITLDDSPAAAVDLGANPADPDRMLSASPVHCRYVGDAPSGTSPKFDCGWPTGES